jgi:hypothetical protein
MITKIKLENMKKKIEVMKKKRGRENNNKQENVIHGVLLYIDRRTVFFELIYRKDTLQKYIIEY